MSLFSVRLCLLVFYQVHLVYEIFPLLSRLSLLMVRLKIAATIKGKTKELINLPYHLIGCFVVQLFI